MDKYEKKNRIIPLLPLRGIWLLPGMVISFDVVREFTKKAIDDALENDNHIFLATQIDPFLENVNFKGIHSYGVLAKVIQVIKLPNGMYRVLVEGIKRAKSLEQKDLLENFFKAEIEELDLIFDESKKEEFEALKRVTYDSFNEYSKYFREISDEVLENLFSIENPEKFAFELLTYTNTGGDFIQNILEIDDSLNRILEINKFLLDEINIMDMQSKISEKVKDRVNDNQREFYLREQLNAINSELKIMEGGSPQSLADEYINKIQDLDIKEKHKEHLIKEAERLEFTANGSPEVNVIRNYLDNVLDIPFGKFSDDIIDLEKSKKILDKDHHGLKEVKERILEFLAVKKLKNNMRGSILCLVGPPGVGKTSIVKSVAESMNREYVSMRLGGMTDESEIRGHRKTYVGAMPGRIITNLQKAKTLNPVFLMDEIDKISSDYKADPASAMLEVLDPNQNDEFMDRFIEIPVDLSNVMFVTTANTTQTIPSALLDRMEVISIPGYTSYDKFQIAKKYLLPKQIEENGLKKSQITVSDTVVKNIIQFYTREAGVRNLERQIAKMVRKAAVKVVNGVELVKITVKNYKEFLGNEIYLDDDIIKKPEVGIVTGLAWTSVGGELLQIEVNTMKGKGNIQLTGSLGDVMKESAMAALSYIKSNQKEFNIEENVFDNIDIHIHVPEGATPKDGPSAGITMTTGILSAITGKKVKQDIAMTGEVTIRGRVLPIGGLKEKSLAAKRYGINKVIIPKQNERDLDDFSEDILEGMKFYAVSSMKEVIELVLED